MQRFTWPRLLFLGGLITLGAAAPVQADDSRAEDEALLKKAHVKDDGASLRQFLRQRSLTDDRRLILEQHIRGLGSKRFIVRQRATRALVAQGSAALPFLRRAVNDPDVEVASRARQCLDRINRGPGPELAAAAVRQLARHAPAEAVETLLLYLPYAESDAVAEEVLGALARLCNSNGRVNPALAAALRDPLPVRRGAAAYVVGWQGDATAQGEVRRLLKDDDPGVQLQAAYGLVSAHQGDGVPVLIALVRNAPDAPACQAEDVLLRLAGDQSPAVTVRGAARQTRRSAALAWEAWWRTHRSRFDWSRIRVGHLGGALIAELETDLVWESGPGGKTRWEMNDLEGPYDVQALAGGRILVAEYTGQRITERDRQGKVLWQYRIDSPVTCRRLRGGNTFIATAHGVLEITPRDQKVYSFNIATEQLPVYSACRAEGSGVVYLACQGGLLALDPAQKPPTPKKIGFEGEIADVEALPNGHLLVTANEARGARIVEIDTTGRGLWEARLKGASAATRLANGQILAVSKENRLLIQLDQAGKVVWKKTTAGRPIRVHRR